MKLSVIPKESKEKIFVDEKKFHELFQARYLKTLEFDNWRVEQETEKKCMRAHKLGRVGQLAEWLGKFHERDLEKCEIPDITIQEVHPLIGYGVITNVPLKAWQFVGEYSGIVRRRSLFFPKLNDYCFAYPKEWRSLYPLTIDSERAGNFTRFINHSDNPNLESVAVFFKGIFHILFRTVKDVEAGSELTYNYGDLFWRDRKKI